MDLVYYFYIRHQANLILFCFVFSLLNEFPIVLLKSHYKCLHPKRKYDPLSNHLKTQTVKENHKIYIHIYAQLT